MLLFGRLTVAFTDFGRAINEGSPLEQVQQNLLDQVDQAALILLGIGLAVWACTIWYGTVWSHSGEKAARRLREAYLKAILRQNVGFHDAIGSGSLTTQIVTNPHLVQEGTSEKVPITMKHAGAFVGEFSSLPFSKREEKLILLAG